MITNKLLAFWQLSNNSLVSHMLMWIIICAISKLVIGNIPHLLSSSTRICNLNQCQSAHCYTNSSALRHCSAYTTLLQAIIMTLVLLYWAPAPYSNRSLASQQLNSWSFMTLESLEHCICNRTLTTNILHWAAAYTAHCTHTNLLLQSLTQHTAAKQNQGTYTVASSPISSIKSTAPALSMIVS